MKKKSSKLLKMKTLWMQNFEERDCCEKVDCRSRRDSNNLNLQFSAKSAIERFRLALGLGAKIRFLCFDFIRQGSRLLS